MPCYYPADAWRSKRVNPETGKRPITFQRSAGYSDMALQVPCGKCDGCQADRAMAWAIRCHQEASLHKSNSFLTITYNDKNLPSDGKLRPDDLRLFFRRLKSGYDFRYFACGEYGDKTRRPHYHALIFGQDFLQGNVVQINENLYSNNDVAETWGNGTVVCAPVTMATCCYVAGYVAKKIGDTDTFSKMSRNPGIGKRWIEKYWQEVANNGTVVIEGRELPVPQRYLAWMQDELFHVKQQRKKKVEDRQKQLGYFELYRERVAKETYQKQRVQQRKEKEKI